MADAQDRNLPASQKKIRKARSEGQVARSRDLGHLLAVGGGGALLVLADQGLIKFKDGAGLKIGPADVIENPKNLTFAELDAAQLPRALDDVDASVINTNYALEAGLNPGTDPIARESEKAPYINVIAVKAADKDAAWVKTLIESYHSDAVKAFIQEEFKGAVIPAW